MRFIGLIVFLCLVVLGVTFSCLNAQPVIVNYYIGTHIFPLSLLLALVLVVGIILGVVFGTVMYVRAKGENLRLHRRARLAEKEVANLRAAPLKEQH